MHHSKKSNITTFNPDALNKLVVKCIDRVEAGKTRSVNLMNGHS
jgi:hypothetical protein